MSRRSPWGQMAERGSIGALHLIRWYYRTFGRRASVALLYPIVAYFYLTGRSTRRASLEYLRALAATPEGRRALGGEPGQRHVFRHILEFAENLLDRMVAWSGHTAAFQIDHEGSEHLFRLRRERRGAILLGAHVGSFDMLRLVAREHDLAVNVLMFTEHAERINAFFEQLDPAANVRVIDFEPGSIASAFELKAAIDRGELVGILGDRLWESERKRSVSVRFLGRRACFPLGPFLLQAVLGCPMLFTVSVRTGPARYEMRAVPFAEAGAVARRDRTKHAEELAQAYAKALEEQCLRTPYQWFNFFPFWEDES